jgi:tetratricopeptide (TPR) repeat protein
VKAKLALQKGELATAAGFYADAAKAFPTVDGSLPLDGENVRLLTGESGVLALARGEYVNALEQLYPVASTYWGDVAHLADRVLTVEELKRFVDAKVPVPAEIHPHQEAAEESSSYLYTLAQPYPATQLRDLLARRLVREGRYQEALPYFHTPNDPHFSDHEVETHVTAYVQALHEAEKSWRRIERARAWYQAAVLARRFGMEMMGYEAAPDFFAIGGSFDFGLGQTTIGGPFVTDGERQRFLASAAHPEARYHYRYRAVEHINRAADLLPPRSQAFAAVLCRATGWMLGTPGAEKLAQDLYHRYVQQGPYVAWATHFGRRCPEPDFTAAARFARTQPFRDASHFARQHRWSLGLGFLALIGLILTGLIRRQRTSLESDR